MRPRADLAIAPVYLLTFLAFTAMVVPVATTWVRSDVDPIVGTLILTGLVLVLFLIATRTERPPRIIPLVTAGIINAFLMIVVAMSVPMWLLDDGRAQQILATVAVVYDGHNGPPDYDLAVDGVPLPGRLSEWPGDGTGALGDEVTVVQDRKGLVDPRLPETLAEDLEGDPRALILPTAGILAALCLATVWPSRRTTGGARAAGRRSSLR
jgi:hypothetical protein